MRPVLWDEWDGSFVDDEITELTEFAKKWALISARAEVGENFVYAEGGAAIRIKVNGYVTEVRGQVSAGGHGRQGAHPARVAALRALVEPVRIVFVDSRSADPSTSQVCRRSGSGLTSRRSRISINGRTTAVRVGGSGIYSGGAG